MTGRDLTNAQHARLDRLAHDEPEATVTGWDHHRSGPVIARPGRRDALIKPDGRLVAARLAERTA